MTLRFFKTASLYVGGNSYSGGGSSFIEYPVDENKKKFILHICHFDRRLIKLLNTIQTLIKLFEFFERVGVKRSNFRRSKQEIEIIIVVANLKN
jgi:hypothetical protein